MKKYVGRTEEIYYVGETNEISLLYKKVVRNKNCPYAPLFMGEPNFSLYKSVYALCIEETGLVSVVNSDTFLYMIIQGEVEEII